MCHSIDKFREDHCAEDSFKNVIQWPQLHREREIGQHVWEEDEYGGLRGEDRELLVQPGTARSTTSLESLCLDGVDDFDAIMEELFTERTIITERSISSPVDIDAGCSQYEEDEVVSDDSLVGSAYDGLLINSTTDLKVKAVPTNQGDQIDGETIRACFSSEPMSLSSQQNDLIQQNPVMEFTSSMSPPQPISKSTKDRVEVITFDVGGKIFRCKADLIKKFPTKRLHQIITCGCDQLNATTYFIDRNPQHFELILDWYRTGKCPSLITIEKEALKDDVKFFDLFEEFFPTQTMEPPPPIPVRPSKELLRQHVQQSRPAHNIVARSVGSPAAVNSVKCAISASEHSNHKVAEPHSVSASMANTSTSEPQGNNPLRFSTRERRMLSPTSAPVVCMVRRHEQLRIVSVKGHGKLLVRVCDATGMESVDVPEAVLFDSRSYFYLQSDRMPLFQHSPLPGDHVYTFWMEPHTDIVNVGSDIADQGPQLDVEFEVLFTFLRKDTLQTDAQDHLQQLAGPYSRVNKSPVSSPNQAASNFSLCLFLPPKQAKVLSEPQTKTKTPATSNDLTGGHDNAMDLLSKRDLFAQQIFTQSTQANQSNIAHRNHPDYAKNTISKSKASLPKKFAPDRHASHQRSSLIKASGAIIASGQKQNYSEGKITIYQRDPWLFTDPTEERSQSDASTTTTVPAKYYHVYQPRLFR